MCVCVCVPTAPSSSVVLSWKDYACFLRRDVSSSGWCSEGLRWPPVNARRTAARCPARSPARRLQHGEAAEAAGDLGGFDGFGDFLEGREIGGADDEADEEQEEVDLYGGWEDGGSSGADSDDGDGMLDGSAIKYEDFFGRSMPYKRAGGPQAARKAGAHGRRHDTSASVATEAAEQREEASAEPGAPAPSVHTCILFMLPALTSCRVYIPERNGHLLAPAQMDGSSGEFVGTMVLQW